jgi:hypothetical protein
MIFQGRHGSFNLFYKDLLISSFALTENKTVERYIAQGEYLIRRSKGVDIKVQIASYIKFCNIMYNRKKKRKPIYRTDHQLFLSILMALMRLKILDEEDCYLVMPYREKK